MRATRIVWARETAAAWVGPATYTAWCVYLFLAASLFALALQVGTGRHWDPAALWTLAAGIPLPLLAALATMSAYAGERSDGTLDLLLTAPVPDRAILLGKFWAALGVVWTGLAGATVPWLLLGRLSLNPRLAQASDLAAPLLVLVLQAATWTALGLLASVISRRRWQAVGWTLLAGFAGVLAWELFSGYPASARPSAPFHPLLAEWLDAAAGRLTLRSLVLHLSLIWWLLFVAARILEGRRWR